MGTRYLFVLLCCFPSTECDSSCATQSPVHASANLPDKRLPGVRGVYYFCPPYSLPRSFLDGVAYKAGKSDTAGHLLTLLLHFSAKVKPWERRHQHNQRLLGMLDAFMVSGRGYLQIRI